MAGRVFLTAGLGGMSGAQAKAAVVAGCIGVVAEVDEAALLKRHAQGWVQVVTRTVEDTIVAMREARANKAAGVSIGFLGNVVALWEALAALAEDTGELLVDLGSDQTSLHNPYNGGYYPIQLGFEEARAMMVADPPTFKAHVQETLRRHVAAVNVLTAKGMKFWDYGNSFLLEASRAGAEVGDGGHDGKTFRYPSYVQDIMGDIFSLGFGPFRWVCTSGDPKDLRETDRIAEEVMVGLAAGAPPLVHTTLHPSGSQDMQYQHFNNSTMRRTWYGAAPKWGVSPHVDERTKGWSGQRGDKIGQRKKDIANKPPMQSPRRGEAYGRDRRIRGKITARVNAQSRPNAGNMALSRDPNEGLMGAACDSVAAYPERKEKMRQTHSKMLAGSGNPITGALPENYNIPSFRDLELLNPYRGFSGKRR